jgi:prepilin-type N-terminal cleavage/methylation domain-containing protein
MPKSSLVYTNTKSSHEYAFTLVELLVAVAIVVVLATVGLIAFQEISKNSRDQIRMGDLQSLKGYMEIYRNVYGSYPARLDDANLKNIVKEFPQDPKQKTSYYFISYSDQGMTTNCSTSGCVAYILCAQKESNRTFEKPTQCPAGYGMGVSEK